MHLLRGGMTFLALVAIVAVVQCKSMHNGVQATDTALVESNCAGVSNAMLCTSTPCRIEVDLDHHTVDQRHVIVRASADVVQWVPRAGGTSNTHIIGIDFKDPHDATKPKGGVDRLLASVDCTNTNAPCEKKFNDAVQCRKYPYSILIDDKTSIDPDVEVGTTTGRPPHSHR